VIVRGLERRHVLIAQCSYVSKAPAAPANPPAAEPFDYEIRHHARVTAIAIRKRVNLRQTVMQARGDFTRRIPVVLYPVAYVIEHRRHLGGDQMRGDADIEFALPVGSGPFPDFAEHLLVQRLDEVLRQEIGGLAAAAAPGRALDDIFLFRLVQVGAARDPGLQQVARSAESSGVASSGSWKRSVMTRSTSRDL
jgi:hypothetical protein